MLREADGVRRLSERERKKELGTMEAKNDENEPIYADLPACFLARRRKIVYMKGWHPFVGGRVEA